ncbi:TPA: AAA family ATPase [Burkholderia vietnamiensis]|nr:AAA family ATPase [Burkholderia vietnamiensis]
MSTELENKRQRSEVGAAVANQGRSSEDPPGLIIPEGPSRRVTLRGLKKKAQQIQEFQEDWRQRILAPMPRKEAPVFTTPEIAEMCNLKSSQVAYLARKEDNSLPAGRSNGAGNGRIFTLAETRSWVQQMSEIYQTPLAAQSDDVGDFRGKVIGTVQLKGGSTKTTTTMCLAQALSLRGRKVLIIDLDPQGSCTELCGLYAEKGVREQDSLLPYIYDVYNKLTGGESNMPDGLRGQIQSTYWDGVDVIPGHTMLHQAEYLLPAMQRDIPGFFFWTVLRDALEPLRKHYDYILMDTAPSLSYTNLNALFAADAMVMPMVPENLDFLSSLTFWNLFSEVIDPLMEFEADKSYSFISILLSRVEYGPQSNVEVVKAWARNAYDQWVDPFEVPASTVMSSSGLKISTVFDMSKNSSTYKSLQRVRQPLVEYARWLDDQFVKEWQAENEKEVA